KRPLNAYVLFCQAHRSEVMERTPSLSFGQVTKELGSMWRSLGEEGKAVYLKAASK
ncbi:unnamed protein product, partial [Discosporangium mesarthrocarpum]